MKSTMLVAVSALTLALAAPAIAADMGAKASRTAAAPVVMAPAYSWSGCYVGGNVGGGWAPTENFYPTDSVGKSTADGVLAGGQIGCDWQFAPTWVVGVQGMYDWANLKGSNFYEPDHSYRDFNKVESLATVTARLGFNVQPASLLYVKGGAAWAKNSPYERSSSGESNGSFTASGWTIGAGWESRFAGNWSWFVEYNFADFGKTNVRFTGADNYHYNIEQSVHQAIVGVNYRFNAAP